jgi:hypothetical protein
MLIALAAAALAASPVPLTGVRANARISVRIISGARVTLGRAAGMPGKGFRPSMIRLEDGSRQSAQLIEFY